MTDRSKKSNEPAAGKKRPRIGKLELNKETVQELAEEEAAAAKGGFGPSYRCVRCTYMNSGCAANTGACASEAC